MKRDFLRLSDFTEGEHASLFGRAAQLKATRKGGGVVRTLDGRTLLLLFEKHSTRTRLSFEAGMQQLGGAAIYLNTRDSQLGRGEPVALRVPLPGSFWRLIAAVAVFGVGNFATAFFTLRAAQMLQPELSRPAALSAAVGFYLAHNAVGAAVSFPAGWLADRIGKVPVLASAYLTFAAACVVGMLGHGWLAVALLALFVGAQNPVVSSVESSLTSSIVEERRLGTAFGILNGVNGVGDLVSSIVAGVLWTLVSPPAAFGFGAVLCAVAALALALRPPRSVP